MFEEKPLSVKNLLIGNLLVHVDLDAPKFSRDSKAGLFHCQICSLPVWD
jgi:hypothetical protein